MKGAEDPNTRDLVSEVTVGKPVTHKAHKDNSNAGNNGKKVVIIDCGTKLGIVRSLVQRGIEVIRVPASYPAEQIYGMDPDGIVISNGPGDPKKVDYLIGNVKKLFEYRIPVFGICLGNQILGLAMGCDTYKLKFGHRGQNHPVMDTASGKCYMSSQNHGFAIDPGSVKNSDADITITFKNVNDGTVEGIRHKSLPVFGVQFHPEACPGPVETGFLFDRFIKMMGDGNAKG
jgi:carbamoyl-phosphate synthase small subunit